MKTTGIFILQHYPISVHSGKLIELIPFGDIHRHAPLCHEARWLEFCKRGIKERNQEKYYIGMGDYDDLASSTERDIFSNPGLHESTVQTMDDFAETKTKKLAKEIDFMRGKLIGLMEGNHFWKFQSGITSTQRLCQIMGCMYLGVSCVVVLKMIFGYGKNAHSCDIKIWGHHGKGASRLPGGSINRVEQMREVFPSMDFYLMGHDHRRGAFPVSVLDVIGGRGAMRLVHKKQWLCRTGSFLRGYVEGSASYIVDGAMAPSDLGVIRLQLIPRANDGRFDVDTHIWS